MSGQAEETTAVMGTSKMPSKDATIASNSAVENKKFEEPKKEKKPGFFARWKASTSEGYEKHRAAGGNL